MDSVLLLALVASALAGALSASSAVEDSSHAATNTDTLYSKYPACLRGREFAILVRKTERVAGQIYNERVKPDGTVQHYICASCTVCGDYGLATASPCTQRDDTECSSYCLMPGCTFDQTSVSCRRASTLGTRQDDVNEGGSNINPCSASMTTQMRTRDVQRPLVSDKTNPSRLRQAQTSQDLTTVVVVGAGAQSELHINDPTLQPHRRPAKPTSKSSNVSSWVASEALFVGMGIVAAVIIANVAAFMYIRSKKRQSKHGKRPDTNSAEVLYEALARARTDSNVTAV